MRVVRRGRWGGYANKDTVYRIVTRTLSEHEVETIDELRAMEASRLDVVQASYWEAAMNRDWVAGRIVLKVMDQRAELLGPDGQPSPVE